MKEPKIRRRSHGLAMIAFLALHLACGPACGASFDLQEATRRALEFEPGYRAAADSLQAGLEKIPQARAAMLPSAAMQANTTMNRGTLSSPHLPDMSHAFNSNGYSLSVTQPLLRLANYEQYRQAEAQVEQAQASFDNARGELLQKVVERYFALLLASENVTLADAQKRALAEQYAQAKKSFEAGLVTITDAKEAQAKYDLVVAQELEAKDELEVALRTIEQLTGVYPRSYCSLRAEFTPLPFEQAGLDHWLDMAYRNNAQLKALAAAVDAAEREIGKQEAAHMPTVDLVATSSVSKGQGQMTYGGIPTDVSQRTFAIQLTIPIFSGGGINSRVRESIAMRDKARNELAAVRLETGVKVRQAYLGVVSGLSRIRALETSIESNRSAVESSRIGARVGTRTNADVLNAQQQLYVARRDYAQARHAYYVNRVKLAAATGTLDMELLDTINRHLEAR